MATRTSAEPRPRVVPNEVVHLGGGLYASVENWQLVLRANDAQHPTDIVYIELPQVWTNLQKFVERKLHEA